MAEISLRQYLKNVEQHIQSGRYEEAIAHGRRILEHFPRLAAAYRLLGLALVGQARWDEAAEVFRRLLSATPDDFLAHQQLSVIYEKLKQPQESLWHLERALDLQPNDQQSVARLRELYSKERGASLDRVPMTTAALANQYLNNGLNDQAIDVLQQAVSRMPERTDLKLMLARAQWQSGQHIEAGETAVEVLQVMPYTLAANRILTELWLEVERPADAQRFLSRVEEVDPYLALRLATGEAAASEALKLPELDYQQHVRRALTEQNPDWLDNLTEQTEQPVDLSAELGDDWMNEIDPAPARESGKRVTDNLPDLLEEHVSDTDQLSGLSPELIARIDAMRGMAADSTAIVELPDLPDLNPKTRPANMGLTGRIGRAFEEPAPPEEEEEELDDSWLDELARNDDFTIEASDVNATDDDWIANLERAAGTTGDRVPTGLTGQLGEFDADDAVDDLDAMLNALESGSSVPAGTPRSATGLTGMLDEVSDDDLEGVLGSLTTDAPPAAPASRLPLDLTDVKTSTKPKRPGALDVDTDGLDWVTEFDHDLASSNTSPLNTENLPSSDAADSLAWLQNTGIEVDLTAPNRANANALADDLEDSGDLESMNPNAWMDALGVEYARTDDLDSSDMPIGPSTDEIDKDDGLAWARGLDLVSSAPTSALPSMERAAPTPDEIAPAADDGEAESDPLDWMSDDDESLLAEYEEFEGLQDDSAYNDPYATSALNHADDGSGDGSFEFSDNFDDLSESDGGFDLSGNFDDLSDENLAENAGMFGEPMDMLGSDDEDDNAILDDADANALQDDLYTEGQAAMQTPSWQPSDPDDPDQPSMSDDLEWLSADSLSDDLGDDTYIPDPDADEPITDLDSFFGGPMAETEGTDEPSGETAWLNDLDLEPEADETPAETPVEPEFDWSIESAEDETPATDASWLSGLGDASAESVEEQGFDWNSGFGDDSALSVEEPDWLADIEDHPASPSLEPEAEGTDETALPAEAGWLADLELEDAADAPAAESDEPLTWQPQSEFDLADEDAAEDENEFGWLTQASDDAVQDFGAMTTETDAWANQDDEAEPAAESWLAELDGPTEDTPISQPLSTAEAGGWLDEDDAGLDWETLDDAEPSPTAGMTGLLNNIESQRYGSDILPPLDTAEDEPAWLESVDGPDAPTIEAETPSWMQDLEAPAEPIASGIDWMSDAFDDEDLVEDTPAAEPAAAEEIFDWENPAFAAEHDIDQLAFGEPDEDEFLYDEADPAFDAEALTDEPALEGEEAGWLSGIGETTDDSWMEAEPAAAEPSWLSDLDTEEPAAEPAAASAWTPDSDGEDEFSFSEDFGVTDDENALPVAETGYFSGTGDESFDVFDENALEDDESLLPAAETGYFSGTADENFDFSNEEQNWLLPDDDVATEQPNWLAEEDAEAESVPVEPVMIEGLEPTPAGFHAEANLSGAEAVAEDVSDDDLRDYDFEEEIVATPASNAPDWLNSMVPGLDLDFEAEDEAVEEEPAAPAPISATRRKDFEWLETIVTEETQQRVAPVAPPPPPHLPAVPSAPSVGDRMRRFVFKDLPSWMRGSPAATVATPSVETPRVINDLNGDFSPDMDDDLFDDMDADFDEFDGFDDEPKK